MSQNPSDPVSDNPCLRNRIVAFVDILGASKAALDGELIALARKIFLLKQRLVFSDSLHLLGNDGSASRTIKLSPGYIQFSDCLLIWSDPLDGLTPQDFDHIVSNFLGDLCSYMGHLLLADVPFRAGVSEGPVFICPERNIYAGRPIVEAVKLEGAQEWLGAAVLFSDRTDRLIRRPDQFYIPGERSILDHFVVAKKQAPLKENIKENILAGTVQPLNWALQEQEGPSYLDLRTKLQDLKTKAGPNVENKYNKAMQFLDAVEDLFPGSITEA